MFKSRNKSNLVTNLFFMTTISIYKNQVLENGKKSILYDLYYAAHAKKQPIIVFCHGYKGFKDWGAWGKMCEKLAEEGIAVLKFNFSHNGGTIENPIDFPDEDAFGRNTYSLEMEDLNRVLNKLSTWSDKYDFIDLNRINLMGHSRGGAIASYVATQRAEVKKLITLASISNWGRPFNLSEEALKQWKEEGVRYVENTRTLQQLPHYYSFYEDYLAHHQEWNLEQAFEERAIPHLIIHGEDDEAVDVAEAEELHQWNTGSQLLLIPNTGHTFGAQHPFEESKLPEALNQAVEEVIRFVKG